MPRGPQSSPTQDLEARFSVFLNPIRDLTKNWEVDIAKYLEEYLEELAEVQITFDGGETLMNFAEAAMLIQGSAAVYSKKVEFLWQMVLQMLDLLHSRRSAELQGNMPVGKEGGGGGRANLDATREFISLDEIGEGKNIDMKDEDEEDDDDTRKKTFKFLPAIPLHLVEKEGEKSQHRINLVMKNNEVFGAKDDFRINRSYLTPMGMLCLELPSELLKNSPAILSTSLIEQEEQDDDAFADAPPSPVEAIDPEPPLPENVAADGNDVAADPEKAVSPDNAADVPNNCDVPSESPQPMEMESEDKTDNNEKQSDNNNIDVIDLPAGRYGLRKRGVAEKENLKLKLSDPWKPIDPHVETPAKRPVRAGRLRKPLPCACHRRVQRPSRARQKDKKKDNDSSDKRDEKSLPSLESYISRDILSMFETKNQKVPPELRLEASKEATKRLELLKNKKIKDILNKGAAQDADEAAQKVVEGTLLQQRFDEQLEDSPDCDAAVDLDNDLEDVPQPPLFFPEPHGVKDPESISTNKRLNESQFDEPGSDYEALVQKWVSEYITSAQDHVNSTDLTRRVNKWRETILPTLEEEERRREFDIHSYGTQVLNFFPENGRKQTVPFHTVARNQDPREVSRLFLSCLMLANTYNLQLSNAVPGDFAMDCLELTLLSRVRHHEELEEYAAPSQSSPTKRKGRVKAISCPDAAYDEPVINSDESPPICADITHITIANNIKVNNCNNSNKGKFKKKK